MKNEIHTLDEVLEKYEALKKEDIIELFPMLKEENRYRFHIE
jgi:sulfite reductase alpha subunit-like flavoprotein